MLFYYTVGMAVRNGQLFPLCGVPQFLQLGIFFAPTNVISGYAEYISTAVIYVTITLLRISGGGCDFVISQLGVCDDGVRNFRRRTMYNFLSSIC